MRTKLLVLALWLTTLPLLTQAAGTSWQDATLIGDGKTLTGTLSTANRQGWFKINVTEDGQADLTATPGKELGLTYMTLYSLYGEELKSRGNVYVGDEKKTLTVKDLKAGTYYLSLDWSKGQGGYSLNYAFTPTSKTYADDGEPNRADPDPTL